MTAAPFPMWDVDISWPPKGNRNEALRRLPAQRGVFAFETANGATLLLAVSADVRRLVRTRLEQRDSADTDSAAAIRRIRALRVGSDFEADWAYLQHARRRLPLEYQLLLDRRQCFWVHVDADATFPRWIKTAHPGRPPTGQSGTYLGPFPDKHAAGRFIELLEDGFDLCRYHHILVQAPDATACAYAEMGKCPAPCDGSISMDEYRTQVRASAGFAGAGAASSIESLEQRMRDAGAQQDFETAASLRGQLERTQPMTRPPFRFVRDLNDLRLAGVLPSTRDGWKRIFIIVGGAIVPCCDVSMDAPPEALHPVRCAVDDALSRSTLSWAEDDIESLGMLADHLFRPANRAEGAFLRPAAVRDDRAFRNAIRRRIASLAEPGADQVMESGPHDQ